MNNCHCGKPAITLTVKKDGSNKGRQFFTCKERECKFFEWADGVKYDRRKFKVGACWRCGRYGCDGIDCEKTTDWFGNIIPDNWEEYDY